MLTLILTDESESLNTTDNDGDDEEEEAEVLFSKLSKSMNEGDNSSTSDFDR